MLEYAELHCHSYFSLLDGVSAPETLIQQACKNGLRALALTDHDSLAGIVRFWRADRQNNLQAIIGAEVTLEDSTHLTLLAETQTGYANLCRLVTAARRTQSTENAQWPGKVPPSLAWSDLQQQSAGLIALSGCAQSSLARASLSHSLEGQHLALSRLHEIFGHSHLYIELQNQGLPSQNHLIRQLLILARTHALPVVATGNVHYAQQHESRLRDIFSAIRHNTTLTATRRAGLLPLNSQYFLPTPVAMAQRFRECPDALTNTIAIAERCHSAPDFAGNRLPPFPTPTGQSEFAYLYQLCHDALPRRYPHLQPRMLKQLVHELETIEQARLAGYFLIVWDIVCYARTQNILCQGRGSAANSLVAYLLGITSIDPLAHNLLFERFLSPDQYTMPDIDIDFAADRREEVIQYVYRRYGTTHAAMVCNVVTYQARSALRDLGKALDYPEATIEQLLRIIDTHSPTTAAAQLEQTSDTNAPTSHPLRHLAQLLRQIDGCPRHLSIHSGGMIITGPPLDTVVPIEPATMPGRYIVQWDKNSVEDAGLIKIDLLGLGMLGAMGEMLTHVQVTTGTILDLNTIPLDDAALYTLLQQADTIGTFQVESRAQQQMLPRLKPERFEDIIAEVAIVRPGPIQGGAVHPYLRRRAGMEPIHYLHPCLEPVLQETLGVVLFQEQAIRIAVAAAGFAPGEADMLRRALARAKTEEDLAPLCTRFLNGAQRLEMDEITAQAIFQQLAGFAGFGFCKSHAASFALIAYQSLYLKHYYPAAFYCALFNQQPMGFYSPEVLTGDAARHGVTLLPPDVNQSQWRYALERSEKAPITEPIENHEGLHYQQEYTKENMQQWALRTGLSAIKGIREKDWQQLQLARQAAPFQSLDDFCQRTHLPHTIIQTLIRAGAFDILGQRRQMLWRLDEVRPIQPDELPLPQVVTEIKLPPLDVQASTLWEYELLGLSPHTQLIALYRPQLRQLGIYSTWEIKCNTHQLPDHTRAQVAGLVVIRQRPSTAKGIMFLSLEDESGLVDLVVKPDIYGEVRHCLQQTSIIIVQGTIQRADRAVSLLVQSMQPLQPQI